MTSRYGVACAVGIVAVGAFALGRASSEAPRGGAAVAQQPEDEMATPMAPPKPTRMHEHMREMVGTWEGTVRFQVGPDQPWMESEATVRREPIMGGLFLLEHVKGQMGDGEAFKGMGILGYNTLEKKYETVWIENMATHMTYSTGSYSEASKEWTFEGEAIDPMTGEERTMISRIDSSDPNKEVMTGYIVLPDGTKHKNFEGTFTKQN